MLIPHQKLHFKGEIRGNEKIVQILKVPKIGYGYYQFSSKPSILELKSKKRPKCRNNVNVSRGCQKYFNVMWDPHVYCGKTFKTFQEVERERNKLIEDASKIVKKKQRSIRPLQLIPIPKTPRIPIVTKYMYPLDQFLIEQIPESMKNDVIEQTDSILKLEPEKNVIIPKIGFDASTQIEDGEMFQFEDEIKPITQILGQKILAQALCESIEEEEINIWKDEVNSYEERLRLDQLRLERLQQRQVFDHNKKIEESKKLLLQKQIEDATEHRVGALMFVRSYLKTLVPTCMESLTENSFIQQLDSKYLGQTFIPWINDQVGIELCHRLLANHVLDYAVEDVCRTRELEYTVEKVANFNQINDE